MVFEIWRDKDGVVVTRAGELSAKPGLASGVPMLVRTIEASTWNQLMMRHHELMGWETYKPDPGNDLGDVPFEFREDFRSG